MVFRIGDEVEMICGKNRSVRCGARGVVVDSPVANRGHPFYECERWGGRAWVRFSGGVLREIAEKDLRAVQQVREVANEKNNEELVGSLISKVSSMLEDKMLEALAEKDKLIAEKDVKIAALDKENAALKHKFAELKQQFKSFSPKRRRLAEATIAYKENLDQIERLVQDSSAGSDSQPFP